jgi:mRNA interferase RelE/StbE
VSYEVRVDEGAIRALADLPPNVQRRIRARIDALADDPRPANAEHLTDPFRGVLRLRVGSYRVSYTIDDKARAVDVWRVGHRSTFYKRLQGR